MGHMVGTSATLTAALPLRFRHFLPTRTTIGLILGPLVGLAIWGLPLALTPTAHRAVAIVGVMLFYWVTETLELGVTALIGCLLFWLLGVASPVGAFSGFTSSATWFLFSALLIGQAASQTGLATRLGYLLLQWVGYSATRLLLGFTLLVCALNLLLSPSALVATLAPLALGLIAAWGLPRHSHLAKGLFLILSYVSTLCSKMFLAGNISILAWGLLAKQTGVHVLWSQWGLAFAPLLLPTVVIVWLTIRWLYPPDPAACPPDLSALYERVRALGPWRPDEYKVVGWLGLALTLWATDFLHHVEPSAIGIAIGLLLTVPRVGVLDISALRAVNFLPVLFIGGALSLAQVLTDTQALAGLTAVLGTWHSVLLSEAWRATLTLYWGGFLYHFLVGSEMTMISTLLPALLNLATMQGYNPAAMTLLSVFAGTGKLFVYQNAALMLGYSYGCFTGRDVLKVGAILTVVEGLFLLILVPYYWPLIGLPWTHLP
jgi:solute carrier family 13 (sodium-dependent dicarboxylate transporter), member 2/3/5